MPISRNKLYALCMTIDEITNQVTIKIKILSLTMYAEAWKQLII